MTTPEYSPLEYWLFVIPLFLLCVLTFIDHLMIVPLSVNIAQATGLPLVHSGLLLAVYPLAAAVSSFCIAPFSDRWGRKKMLFLLGSGFGLASLGCALSSNVISIFIFRIASGLFAGPIMPNAISFAGDRFSGKQRARAITFIMLGFSIASIMGVPFGAWLGDEFGWQAPFFFITVLSGVCLLIFLRMPAIQTGAETGVIFQQYQELLTLWKLGHVRLLFLIQFCMIFGLFGVVANLSLWLSLNYTMTATEIGLCYMQGGVGGILANLLAGRLLNAGYKTQLISWGSTLMGLFLAAGTFEWFSKPYVGLFFALLMFSGSLRFPALQLLLTEMVPISFRGRLTSMSMIVSHITMGIGSIWCLPFLTVRDNHLFGMPIVGVVGCGTLFLSAALILRFKNNAHARY